MAVSVVVVVILVDVVGRLPIDKLRNVVWHRSPTNRKWSLRQVM